MQVALKLATLDEPETLSLGRKILAGLGATPSFTPKPTIIALNALVDAVDTANENLAAAEAAMAAAVVAKNNAFDALRAGLTQEAGTVEDATATMTDAQAEALIADVGMRARSTPTRVTSIDAVTGLSITAGDAPGEIDWHCNPVGHASFYMPEYTTDPVSPTAHWLPGRPGTASSGKLTGLTSGAAVSVRLHAEGSRGLSGGPAIAGPKIVP